MGSGAVPGKLEHTISGCGCVSIYVQLCKEMGRGARLTDEFSLARGGGGKQRFVKWVFDRGYDQGPCESLTRDGWEVGVRRVVCMYV